MPWLNLRQKQVHKARAWKFFLHLFNTYGINRRAWYMLTICLSFVSPNILIISHLEKNHNPFTSIFYNIPFPTPAEKFFAQILT